MWCNDGKIITKGEHAYRVFLQLEKMTPLHKMTLIDDTDCQNILATTVLSLQAITAQKDVKDPWKLLPPAGQLIERIGAMRDSKVFILTEEDRVDILDRISSLVRLQTLEPAVIATMGRLTTRLSEAASTSDTPAEEALHLPQTLEAEE